MKPELLEKYIADARLTRTSDEDIKKQLVAGGWDALSVDKALKFAATNQAKAQQMSDESFVIPHPIFFPTFLTIFIILLAVFNIITYWEWIIGLPTARAVTNGELAGGLVTCLILSLCLSGIYTGIHNLFKKHKK